MAEGTMNAIIKQLAEQAGMNIKTNVIGTALVFGTFEGNKTSHITTEELEKFAELAIKETMRVVARQLGSNQYSDVEDAIVEHFGVTE